MKKFAILATVVALIGCTQNDEGLDNITNTPEKSQTEFYASMPECDTRTYVEDNKYLRWNTGDEITVFAGNSYNGHWQFTGEDGANSGKFNKVDEGGFVTGTPLDLTANYAIYPYDENITISEAGVVSLALPAVQEYNHTYANSFGEGANTMMAVTKNTADNFLSFKNLCGYLKLKFYGDDVTVKSVSVKGNNGEKIAGSATVAMAYGSEPIITMGDDATDTITIDCGEGVELSNDVANPTIFWVVIPEITFEGGITIEVTDINDQTYEKKTTNVVPIENNLIQPMAALGVSMIPENRKIYYTSTAKITPYATNVFGAEIVSNDWNAISMEGIIIFDDKVTSIGNKAFYICRNLLSITIPETVTSIGTKAFYKCMQLQSATIPNGVTSIGGTAFCGCSSLTSVTIGNSVTSIGDSAFSGCSSLQSITIPDRVTSIGVTAFDGCSSLTNVTIGNSVTSIGVSAFRSCSSLQSITIPDSVTSIGGSAFYGCSSLTSVTIPSSVLSIGKEAFVGCTGKCIVKCTIPSASFTGGGWFAYSDFTSVEIKGATVKGIGDYAFYGCASITSITIDNDVSGAIGRSAFESCVKLKSLVIGNGITTLGGWTFQSCSSLSTLSLGSKLQTIGDCSFGSCSSLTSVTIPSSVTSIGTNAFYECKALTKVYCNPTTPPTLGYSVFKYYKYGSGGGVKNLDCTFYVPSSSLSAYKTAQHWSDHASQIVSK